MADSILTNAQDFTFKGIDLHGSCEGWEDDMAMRLASYEYLKRDGAEVDPNGAAQKKWSFSCVYMGADCGTRYKNLAAAIQQDPKGPFVHPRLGNFNVACASLRGRERPATAIDCIEFTIELVEDQVDQSIRADLSQGAQRYVNYVQDALTTVSKATSKITQNRLANAVYAALVATQAQLMDLITKLIGLCLSVSQSTPDSVATSPDLIDIAPVAKLLEKCRIARDETLAVLLKTLPYSLETDVSLTDARTGVYLAYAHSVRLYNIVLAQRPPTVDFVVPMPMPLTVIAVRIYGKDARQRISEIYQLNRIPRPYWIPAGTVLKVLAPIAS